MYIFKKAKGFKYARLYFKKKWAWGCLFFIFLYLYFTSNMDEYCQILTDIVQTVMGLRSVAGVYNIWALCTIEIQFKFSLIIAPP